MDARTRAKFERMWQDGVGLAEIATKLGYSFSTLAKLRIQFGLKKRYGTTMPTREVIRIRCLRQQTNWTETDRAERWRGEPHTIYESIIGYDEQ